MDTFCPRTSSLGTLGVYTRKIPCPTQGVQYSSDLVLTSPQKLKMLQNWTIMLGSTKLQNKREGRTQNQKTCGQEGRAIPRGNLWKMQTKRMSCARLLGPPPDPKAPLPTPALLNMPGSTSMMWLGQYFRYSGISYSLTTRRWRWLMPSIAWKRFRSPCSWRPLEGVKMGLLTAFRFCERKTNERKMEK